MTTLIKEKPAQGERIPWTFPAAERATTDGVTVLSSHLPGRPMVSLRVIADAGAVTDPSGLEGIAELTVDALPRGARGLDEEGVAIAFEMVGASPRGRVSYDSASFGLTAPGGLLGEAAELVADVVRRPTLATDQIEKVREEAIAGQRAMEARPQFVAGRARRAAFHASESRYRLGSSGSIETLSAIDADAVRAFHAERWARAPLTVVVAGDLTGVDLDAIASAFKADVVDVPLGSTSSAINAGGRRIVLADMPGSVQSVISLTAPGPKRDIPDEPQLDVAQSVVLSAFGSRINDRLREDLGYTYGARGAFSRLRDGGTMEASLQVRNEVTGPSVREAIKVLTDSVGERPLTDDEVEQARDNLVSKFAVQYDGSGAIAGALAERVVYGLDDDEHDVMLARLQTVTTEQANECWRRYLDLDELLVTVTGDAEAVRPSLEELDLPVIDA